jgi:hypothetical protein
MEFAASLVVIVGPALLAVGLRAAFGEARPPWAALDEPAGSGFRQACS